SPETQLLCSDSDCDLGQFVVVTCFRRSGTLSSRLPAYKSLLLLPIAAKAGGVSVFIPRSSPEPEGAQMMCAPGLLVVEKDPIQDKVNLFLRPDRSLRHTQIRQKGSAPS
ncbi:MAG TPA: hypothetical protein VFP11_14785, partial [Candidatus Angelobacter sp.]|nr:hypothetical protein [Candidatus Angelobacter sp.]